MPMSQANFTKRPESMAISALLAAPLPSNIDPSFSPQQHPRPRSPSHPRSHPPNTTPGAVSLSDNDAELSATKNEIGTADGDLSFDPTLPISRHSRALSMANSPQYAREKSLFKSSSSSRISKISNLEEQQRRKNRENYYLRCLSLYQVKNEIMQQFSSKLLHPQAMEKVVQREKRDELHRKRLLKRAQRLKRQQAKDAADAERHATNLTAAKLVENIIAQSSTSINDNDDNIDMDIDMDTDSDDEDDDDDDDENDNDNDNENENENEEENTLEFIHEEDKLIANNNGISIIDSLRIEAEAGAQTFMNNKSKRKSTTSKENLEKKPVKLVIKPIKTQSQKEIKAIARLYHNTYDSIWKDMARKDASRLHKMLQSLSSVRQSNARKTAMLAAREARKWQLKTNKNIKDVQSRARRAMREMLTFWRKNEREERDSRRKAEKEAVEKAKKEEEQREAKRQSRKLNFLITQTELYSHFIGKKIQSEQNGNEEDEHFDVLNENAANHNISDLDFDNADDLSLKKAAAANAKTAIENTRARAQTFNGTLPDEEEEEEEEEEDDDDDEDDEMNFQNPTSLGDLQISQPGLLTCQLKGYQLKGLNWLANLYEQGINGILADEMGLGKTVQSISVLAYLAEKYNIWGPFLVVSPSSTLHNWEQEISKFVPQFKVLPYWGNGSERKVLRKFWDRKQVTYTKDSPFHVLITSYNLVVTDAQYLSRIKWQYMILDEAQAIKSSQSSRWKCLLGFQCRNRLLLTGTPIQNSMQELWALLHFIMPSLFDSHDEFSEWFSKDIESHAQSNTQLNEQQLRRLHVILKPFMLRRIKKDVQSELGDKIEIDVYCDLTTRQKKMYKSLESQISPSMAFDLMEKVSSSSSTNTGKPISSSNDNGTGDETLMNLVMQFRKVCNHPDLFERADTKSAFSMTNFAETSSFLRERGLLNLYYSSKNPINFKLPKLIYKSFKPNFNNNQTIQKKFENNLLNIWNPNYIKNQMDKNNCFTWLKFIDLNPSSISKIAKNGLFERALEKQRYTDTINNFKIIYENEHEQDNKKLLITDLNDNFNSFVTNEGIMKELTSIKTKVYEEMFLQVMEPAAESRVIAPIIQMDCSNIGFYNDQESNLFNKSFTNSLYPMTLNQEWDLIQKKIPLNEFPHSNLLPLSINKRTGYSTIRIPSMNRFVTSSGKLSKLDHLLQELKTNDHRVLIYFQMTKMMDLMEEFLTYRQYKYIRLDGSSKLSDRRDLVSDWQTKPELFVFLLSTRAGGLGINLTAADTVVFYDSDWNPTIDSQAMDRAHRLGQKKQVTVYRLLVKGTIEERMRDRAMQKEHVQQVVMEGTGAPDHNNKKQVLLK